MLGYCTFELLSHIPGAIIVNLCCQMCQIFITVMSSLAFILLETVKLLIWRNDTFLSRQIWYMNFVLTAIYAPLKPGYQSSARKWSFSVHTGQRTYGNNTISWFVTDAPKWHTQTVAWRYKPTPQAYYIPHPESVENKSEWKVSRQDNCSTLIICTG